MIYNKIKSTENKSKKAAAVTIRVGAAFVKKDLRNEVCCTKIITFSQQCKVGVIFYFKNPLLSVVKQHIIIV